MIQREADREEEMRWGGQRWGAEEISQKTGGGGEKQKENKKTKPGGEGVPPRRHERQSAELLAVSHVANKQNPQQ